jgi:lipoprotein-anchoring transpeptidase ErfK/SrfK
VNLFDTSRVGRRALSAIAAIAAASFVLSSCTGSDSAGPTSSDTTVVAPTGSSDADIQTPSTGASASTAAGTTTDPTTPTTTAPAASKAVITVTPDGSGSPSDPITVSATNGTLQSVTVLNHNGVGLPGAYNGDKTSWSSSSTLAYGADYKVEATAVDSAGVTTSTTKSVSMVQPKKLVFPSFFPAASTTDVGVGEPLRVVFLESPDDKNPVAPKDKAAVQKALKVTSNPPQDGAWYWIDDHTVDYRPKDYWKAGTTITLNANIYGVSFGDDAYGVQNRTATYHVHDAWVAKADGATETMKIYKNDVLQKTMPISMGKQATPTHLGTHVISAKANPYRMNSCTYGVCKGDPGYYDSLEYYAARISNDGEFVHENPKSVDAQGSTNVSHGCINLNEENAKWFYEHFGIGDVVEVTNSGGPQLPVYDLWGDWSLSWSQLQAGNANS